MAIQKGFLVCVVIFLQLTNYGLSAGDQDIHKRVDGLSVDSGVPQVTLERQKRQSFMSCPNRPASGSGTGRSYVLFYSPNSRQDVTIAYGGSKKGWTDFETKKLAKNGFNSSQPSLIYLHAYTQSAQSDWLQKMRKLYDEEFPARSADKPTTFNLLFFDWSAYSRQAYGTSVSWVPHLGKVLGDFLDQLANRYSYNLNEVHLVSYSLSTHIAGNAGRRTRSKVGQITALDPTGVCLHHDNAFARKYALKAGDAKLVVARHYDMNGLGAKRAIGGVDIYVNGGRNQPGSAYNGRRKRASGGADEPTDENSMVVSQSGSSSVGSHARAAEHESQAEDEKCYELAYACRSYAAFLAGECASCGKQNNRCYYLNNIGAIQLEQEHSNQVRSRINYNPKSRMYIKTGPSKYCLHHYQFIVKLKSNSTPNVKKSLKSGQVSFELEATDRQVAPKHQTKGTSYTALITSNRRLKNPANIRLVMGGSSKVNQNEFASSVEQVELNYMSHAISSERERLSSRYCWNSATNVFVRCQPESS